MKKMVVALLLCCGCEADANVLSSDGSKSLKVCYSSWNESGTLTKCLHDTCPNGYDLVDMNCDPVLVKCKP